MHNSLLERMSTARGALRTVNVPGNTVTELASPSDRRGSITFFGASGPYTIGLSASLTETAGIRVPDDSTTPVVLTLQQHGDLVQQGFYAIHTGAGVLQITYAECIFQGP